MAGYNYRLVSLEDIKRLSVAHQSQTSSKMSRINSMDFHINGELFIYNSSEQIFVLQLTEEKVFDSNYNIKYGAGLCRFVDEFHIVHTSNKDDIIRLLSLVTKNYVRYFPGHSKEVNSLSVFETSMASGASDSTFHLWDVRVQKSVKRMEFPSPPLVAFHPFGAFIVVAHSSSIIEIYDRSNFLQAINTFSFERIEGKNWTGLKFSDNGSMLMVTSNSTSILIISIITGQELHNFRDYNNPQNMNIDACFTTGSNFVIGGDSEGFLNVWDCETSTKVHCIKNCIENETLSFNIVFNPKFMNMATSSENVVQFWNEKC